jgi:nitrate reductase NapA
VLFSRILDRRRADPAVRIIELATRTTRTSYAADRSILHAPHAGLALAHAIAHELVTHGAASEEFIDRYVAFKRGSSGVGHGLTDDALVADPPHEATLGDYVRFLGEYAPDRIRAQAGVAPDVLRWLASVYGDRSRRVLTVWGSGVHRSARGAWLNGALHALHLLVGKVGTPGNGPLPLTGQPGGGGAVHDAGSLAHTLPRGTVTSERDRERAAAIWNVPAERIDARPGLPALAMFRALDRGDLRFLWIQATNPMVSLPNADRYRRAARKDDRFIVVTDAYPTPTTDIADVVLPATLWMEREGVTANAERRLQYAPALVPPPGDATGDAWLMIEVARRIGLADLFPWNRQEHVAQIWEEYRRFHDVPLSALPSLDDLRRSRGLQWPVSGARETPRRYSTTGDVAARPARGDVDFYGHQDGRAWIWLRPVEPPAESPDAEFPFWLDTGPVLEHWGGGAVTQRIPALHRSVPHAYVEINRDDASRMGIRHGDRVRLVTRRGALEIEARIDYRAQPPCGLVFVPTFDEGHPVNRLTLDAQCPISGHPGAGACAARVERVVARGSR